MTTTEGSLWLDNDTGEFRVFYGNAWAGVASGPVGATGVQGATGPAGAPGGAGAGYDTTTTSTGYLALSAGTTAQRPVSPPNGAVRFNTSTGYGEIYSTAATQWLQFGAAPVLSVEYLVVGAGGGASGGTNQVNYGSGAASGVVRTGTLSAVNLATPINITVGAGGAGSLGNGGNGSSSVFSTATASGGNGSSTGFAGANNADYSGAANGGGGTAAGGGAGAGGNGVLGTGGPGALNSITGSSLSYGGGGGSYANNGGTGGGAAGCSNGTVNTGGGGGGCTATSSGGTGGSGVVIIKYLQSYAATFSAGLVTSTSVSAGYKVSTITSGTGTVTFSIA